MKGGSTGSGTDRQFRARIRCSLTYLGRALTDIAKLLAVTDTNRSGSRGPLDPVVLTAVQRAGHAEVLLLARRMFT